MAGPDAGDELLDLVQQGVGVAREEQVVGPVELNELGPGDAVGEVATHLGPHHPVGPPVEHDVGTWIAGSTSRMFSCG